DGEVGDGDADLGAGELGRERTERELDAARALVATGRRAFDARPVDGYEGELGGHEQTTGGHEGQRHEQEQEGGHDAHPVIGAVVPGLCLSSMAAAAGSFVASVRVCRVLAGGPGRDRRDHRVTVRAALPPVAVSPLGAGARTPSVAATQGRTTDL